MRVLSVGNVYPPHSLGGYEIVWRGVTAALRDSGHASRMLASDFRLAGVGEGDEADGDVHRELRWYWHDHDWPPMGMRERWRLERHNAEVFDRHVREFDPDVLAWWPMGGMSLSLIERARRAGLPAVLFVHDYWPSYGPTHDLWTHVWSRPYAAPLARVVEARSGVPARYDLAAAGRWLFNSECVRQETLATGLRLQDTGVLSPGIERPLLDAAAGGRDEPPPWDWRLLYIGRVVDPKGVHTALEALAHLPATARLRIVGDGDEPYLKRLRELATELGVAERVSFEGSLDRNATFGAFRAADAVVFPVIWSEPWGLVPLEAMALGRPVVATGRGGSADFLRDGDNSLLFEVGDAAALARALMRLADDAALRERLRAAGYETALRHGEPAFNSAAVAELARAADRVGAART